MFGYIYVNQKELSDQDKKTYQAYYCGLCRCLKKEHGLKGQMLLNYDMTFLVILLSGLYELKPQKDEFICAMHPGRKKISYINEATRYAAAMNVMLSYHNLIDDWKDDHSYSSRVLSRFLEKDYQAASAKYPRQSRALEHYMEQLDVLEAAGEKNIDAIAGLTGEMLGEVFAWKDDLWMEELRCMGFYLGKFIYLMDAYEDLEKDSRNDEYNPLSHMAETNSHKDFETFCKLILTSMMSETSRSFERLPVLQHAGIIRNVLYSGVWAKYEMIHSRHCKKQEKLDTKSKKAADKDAKKEKKIADKSIRSSRKDKKMSGKSADKNSSHRKNGHVAASSDRRKRSRRGSVKKKADGQTSPAEKAGVLRHVLQVKPEKEKDGVGSV